MELMNSVFDASSCDSSEILRPLLNNKNKPSPIAIPLAIAAPLSGLKDVVGILTRRFAAQVLVLLAVDRKDWLEDTMLVRKEDDVGNGEILVVDVALDCVLVIPSSIEDADVEELRDWLADIEVSVRLSADTLERLLGVVIRVAVSLGLTTPSTGD